MGGTLHDKTCEAVSGKACDKIAWIVARVHSNQVVVDPTLNQ
jgi:hypothetical protein